MKVECRKNQDGWKYRQHFSDGSKTSITREYVIPETIVAEPEPEPEPPAPYHLATIGAETGTVIIL